MPKGIPFPRPVTFTEHITVPVTRLQHQVWQRAAEMEGITLTEFMRRAANERSINVALVHNNGRS